MIIISLVVLAASLWVAARYKAIGAIGLAGLVIAGTMVWENPTSPLHWVIGAISAILFVLGQVVEKRIDDYFHWGALFVNVVPLTWWLILWIIGWPIWTEAMSAPVVLIVLGVIALIIVTVLAIVKLVRWIYRVFARRHPPEAA